MAERWWQMAGGIFGKRPGMVGDVPRAEVGDLGYRGLAIVLLLIGLGGCTERNQSGGATANQGAAGSGAGDRQRAKDLFDSSIRSLHQLDTLANLSRYDERMGLQEVISTRLKDWMRSRQPPTAWEPDPNEALLDKITERLSGWAKVHAASVQWAPDPLIETLPEPLQKIPEMQRLSDLNFNANDGHALREALWLKTISAGLVTESTDDLAAATKMFDWVVRNIQLDGPGPADSGPPKPPMLRQFPWQAALYGHGTAEERAWVFLGLARQQGLRVVILALPDGEGKPPRYWLPALVHDGNLYLFDTQLGLPIPGPNGEGIATLAQVAADDSLLRRLDLNEQRPYPVRAEQLAGVTVYLEGTPAYLSKRMAVLQSALAGEERLAVFGKPSAWVESLKTMPNVAEVKLWPLPQETYAHADTLPMEARQQAMYEFTAMISLPPLWTARVLQWRKDYDTPETNAVRYFYEAMPNDEDIQNQFQDPSSAGLVTRSKQNATYWLGLLQVDRGKPADAIQYFQRLTLDQWPDGPWTAGAKYNLARVYEEIGEPAKAVALYAADVSPQFHGNRLRGRWLAEKQATQPAAEVESVETETTE